jgi:hypothetical protein
MAKRKRAKAARPDKERLAPRDARSPTIAAESPFSEMISRWLDDGDRLHESTSAGGFSAELADHPGRVRAFITQARARVHHHRRALGGAALLTVIMVVFAFHLAYSEGAVSSPSSSAASDKAPPVSTSAAAPSAGFSAAAIAAAPAVAPSPAPSAPPGPSARAPEAARLSAVATVTHRPAHRPEVATPIATPLEGCRSALVRQRARDALAACRQVFAREPRSADAMVLLARADLLSGRAGETLQLARRAVAANPRDSDAYLLIGSVEQTNGNKREARTAYELYLQLAPSGARSADVRAILRTL